MTKFDMFRDLTEGLKDSPEVMERLKEEFARRTVVDYISGNISSESLKNAIDMLGSKPFIVVLHDLDLMVCSKAISEIFGD